MVEIGAEMNINEIQYELVGVVDHRGNTMASGHYVSYIRSEKRPWMFCDDNNISSSSLERVNNEDNYILLLKKKETFVPDVRHDVEEKLQQEIYEVEVENTVSNSLNNEDVTKKLQKIKC